VTRPKQHFPSADARSRLAKTELVSPQDWDTGGTHCGPILGHWERLNWLAGLVVQKLCSVGGGWGRREIS